MRLARVLSGPVSAIGLDAAPIIMAGRAKAPGVGPARGRAVAPIERMNQ